MQQISGTIRIYWNNSKKIDFIMKKAYNKNIDIRCVGAGIGDRGGTYLLFLYSESLMEILDEWENRTIGLEKLREY